MNKQTYASRLWVVSIYPSLPISPLCLLQAILRITKVSETKKKGEPEYKDIFYS